MNATDEAGRSERRRQMRCFAREQTENIQDSEIYTDITRFKRSGVHFLEEALFERALFYRDCGGIESDVRDGHVVESLLLFRRWLPRNEGLRVVFRL